MNQISLFVGGVMTALCLISSGNANAFCDRYPVDIKIVTHVPEPKYYHHLKGADFPVAAKTKMPDSAGMMVRGLTVSKVDVSGTAKSYVESKQKEVCVGLKEITFEIGLEKLDVYIDKKYRVHSCAYKVVKEHEDIHVNIFRQAVTFYRRDIESELRKAVDKLYPVSLYKSEATARRIDELTKREFMRVLDDIKPLLNFINRKIDEKNSLIDTEENYRATSAKCRDW